MKKLFIGIFFLISFFLTTSPAWGAETERIIVKFRRFTPSVLTGETERLKLKDTYVLKVSKGSSARIIEALRKNFNVEYAEEDAVALALETPNDPGFPNQWGLTKIKAPGAWDATHGEGSVDIAIVDTGINIKADENKGVFPDTDRIKGKHMKSRIPFEEIKSKIEKLQEKEGKRN